MGQPELVSAEEVWAAVRAVEADKAAGTISPQVAAERIDRCRRAVTPRDLWKATGGKAGSPTRSGGGGRGPGRLVDSLIDGLSGFLPR
jgi:hypothetical protein